MAADVFKIRETKLLTFHFQSKIDMLDSLLEIEVAYSLLKSDDPGSKESSKKKDPIDAHYDKLKTKIEVLGRKTDEFKILEEYVKNTHAATHNMYSLEIQEVNKYFSQNFHALFWYRFSSFFFFPDFQDQPPGGGSQIRAVQEIWQPNASLARIQNHKLCWNSLTGTYALYILKMSSDIKTAQMQKSIYLT